MGSGENTTLRIPFSVMLSWQLHGGVVPAHRIAMDTSIVGVNFLTFPTNLQGTTSQAQQLVMSLIQRYKVVAYQILLKSLHFIPICFESVS